MRAVVFDWDGTLVDTLPAILWANTKVLGEYGVPFDESMYRSSYAPDWRNMYLRLGLQQRDLDAATRRWLELYETIDGLGPFPGVVDALSRLASAGNRLGLVTAGDRRVVEEQLRRFGLADLLPVRVCGDDPLPPKPDPAPLRRALADLGAAAFPETSVYVGDAPDDMRMARAVGIRGVGIVGPLAGAEDLRAAGAAEASSSVVEWIDAYLAGRTVPIPWPAG